MTSPHSAARDPRLRARRPNGRVLVASVVLILGIAVYAVLAVTLGEALPDHKLIEAVYIAAAGLVWVWPAVWLVRWASRRSD